MSAAVHKRIFERLLRDKGVTISVRFPPTSTTNAGGTLASKVFGERNWETTVDEVRTQEYLALWSNDGLGPEHPEGAQVSNAMSPLSRAGEKIDAMIRVSLAGALLDVNAPQGLTVFDICKDVQYAGASFQVVKSARTGLPPLGPYILWVALRKLDRRES